GGSDVFATMSTSTIEKLNILDRVTADRVTARVTTWLVVQGDDKRFEVNFRGSTFVNLAIDGMPIRLTQPLEQPDDDCVKPAGDSRIVSLAPDFGLPAGASLQEDGSLYVKNCGRLCVGEGEVIREANGEGGFAQLTMFRFKLGCPGGGTGTGGGGGGGGGMGWVAW